MDRVAWKRKLVRSSRPFDSFKNIKILWSKPSVEFTKTSESSSESFLDKYNNRIIRSKAQSDRVADNILIGERS